MSNRNASPRVIYVAPEGGHPNQVEEVLEENGIVVAVENGVEDCVRRLENDFFDCVVTDIRPENTIEGFADDETGELDIPLVHLVPGDGSSDEGFENLSDARNS
ncbi:MAG: hypothetical protein SV760_07245, partial [Halobacteria archaeon]|nr:hypothetical protein [Halobacteria archaeon]